MTSSEFPGNSKHPRQGGEEKKVEAVVSGEVSSRKKPLGKRFKEVFIGGDSRSVINYVVMDVLVPQAKDMLTEASSSFIERLIYGDNRPRRGPRTRPGETTHTPYNRYAQRGNNPIGRAERGDRPTPIVRQQTLDEIILATRVEAETVLDRMYDLLNEYEMVSVSDLYSLVGWSASYVDQKWGWTNLQGSSVHRVRDGYVLNLPKTQALD